MFASEPFQNSTLVNGSFKKISSLPPGIDPNEWVAANSILFNLVVDFHHFTQLFYAAVVEFCNTTSCPVMNAGGEEYLWIDAQKRTVKFPANQYAEVALGWIQQITTDENVFPTKNGVAFPKEFPTLARNIFRHLFRVLAHIYHCHYEVILHLSAEAHLNTLTGHFLCFVKEFDLIERKELLPLQDMIQSLEESGRI